MAQPADPIAFTPDALADETLFDDEEPRTRPGVERPRVTAPRSAPRAKNVQAAPAARAPLDPDAEALAIATRVVEKVAVARSLVRIFGGLARANASAASSVLRAYADRKIADMVEQDGGPVAHVERARKVATAATEAAKHAARLAVVRAAARATEIAEAAEAELDAEDLRDDAC